MTKRKERERKTLKLPHLCGFPGQGQEAGVRQESASLVERPASLSTGQATALQASTLVHISIRQSCLWQTGQQQREFRLPRSVKKPKQKSTRPLQ